MPTVHEYLRAHGCTDIHEEFEGQWHFKLRDETYRICGVLTDHMANIAMNVMFLKKKRTFNWDEDDPYNRHQA